MSFYWLEWLDQHRTMATLKEKSFNKRLFFVMNLLHILIYCEMVNYKAHLKHCGFRSLKGSEIHSLLAE